MLRLPGNVAGRWSPSRAGGLSHALIDEEFDRQALDAIVTKDVDTLVELKVDQRTSGTGELRCWVGAAGALEPLQMQLLNYVPGYRSPAATGCAMAFALWQ